MSFHYFPVFPSISRYVPGNTHCSRPEVPRGGVGQGGGVSLPKWKENGNKKMLR